MHIASTFPLTLRRVHSWLKKLSSNRSLSLFFTLSALTITPVFAQVPEPLLSPAEEPVAEDPYWRETVDKAIEQYQSENPDIRRSAVMLLGKYPVPPAQETVAKALEDSDASVRQAALVSVLEEQMQIPPATREKLFSLLQDRSVSIRRIASNSLPMILGGFPFTMQPGANQLTRQMPDHVLESLQKAFRDEDASVRRNMVTNYQYLRIQLPPETVTALLHDPDPQVAIHAIQWALPMIEPANLPEEVEKMMERDDPNFRLELIRALQSRFSPGMMSIFQKLQQ
ncbi:MAG TPA: HEAT repeat domain-containing protein, partial [Opitutales bacterium]|nr:HEAT repeat domain-containing protein [Opitutales bacterium]